MNGEKILSQELKEKRRLLLFTEYNCYGPYANYVDTYGDYNDYPTDVDDPGRRYQPPSQE